MSTPEPHVPPHICRLDENTWKLHDEPPSAVDATRDRAAIRIITVYWVFTGALFVWLFAAIVPSLLGVPTFDPAVLIVGFILLCATAIGFQLRWRAVRRTTGYPITPTLYPLMEPAASVMADAKALFHVTLDDMESTQQTTSEATDQDGVAGPAEATSADTDTPQTKTGMSRAEGAAFKRHQRKRRRALKQSTARIVLRVEQAAAAERWGWHWWSQHCFNKIKEQIDPYANLLINLHGEKGDSEATDTAQARDGDPPTERSPESSTTDGR